MNIHKKHCNLLDEVNHAKTAETHQRAGLYLLAWCDGVEAAGLRLDYVGCDWYYLNQGHTGPMCCGVWQDWTPGDES